MRKGGFLENGHLEKATSKTAHPPFSTTQTRIFMIVFLNDREFFPLHPRCAKCLLQGTGKSAWSLQEVRFYKFPESSKNSSCFKGDEIPSMEAWTDVP